MRLTLIILALFVGIIYYYAVNTTYTRQYGKIIDYPMCSGDRDCRARAEFPDGVRIVTISRHQNPLIDDVITIRCSQSPIKINNCRTLIGRH